MRESEYGYKYPLEAMRHVWKINVRLMQKDEMPDDGETYYCDKEGTIYKQGEPDFDLLSTQKE